MSVDGELLAPLPPTANPLVFLERFMERNPEKDPSQILDFLERLHANQAAVAFADALTKFQRICPPVEKCNPVFGKNRDLGPQYHFAGFDDIMDIAAGPLNECGIVVTFTTKNDGPLMTTTCRVRVGTHSEESSITLALPAIPNANDSQRAGGAQKYGMRYAMCAALNIRVRGEDDDAQSQVVTLDEKQVVALNELLSDCREAGSEVDWEAFKRWIEAMPGQPPIENIGGILAANFEKAKGKLQAKLAQAKKGAKA